MTNFKHVYLSGGMEYADNEGRDWRQDMHDWLQAKLNCEVFNPNVESDKFFAKNYPGIDVRSLKESDIVKYASIVSLLVEIDCREIAERSELVVCYWDDSAQRGAGTKGELTIAKHFGKPVYMVTSMPYKDIPGWVLGCTTLIFSSFDELKEFLVL
jgi:hypothetical protein